MNEILKNALLFFIEDTIKILLMLGVMVFILGIIKTYYSYEKMTKVIKKAPVGVANILASVLGAITPFCTCSSIPLFITMIKARIPIGVSSSFLITSPLINQYLVVVMLPILGWKITTAYVVAGLLIGIIGGLIIEKTIPEKEINLIHINKKAIEEKTEFSNYKERIVYGLTESKNIIKDMWLWIILGVGIGAAIHSYVPKEAIDTIINSTGSYSVLIATAIGVPMYASCVGVIPIAAALLTKGVPVGTALAFMMALSGLSLPEAIILKKVMSLKAILIFFGIVALGIIAIGYGLNAIQPILIS